MSISSITYDGFGKTMRYEEMESAVEDAINNPSTVLVPKDTEGIRSLDRVHSFGIQNILTLPFKFFMNVGKLINAYKVGDKQEISEGWIRVTTYTFGLGGVITEGVKTAITINMITNVALFILTPLHAAFAALYFMGQFAYELIQGTQADEYVQLTHKVALDTLGKTGGASSSEERGELSLLLEKDRETVTERIGAQATDLLFTLLSKKLFQVDREEGFSQLEAQVGREMAEFIFQITDDEKSTIEEEDLFRIIEARFIEETLHIIQNKSTGLTPNQKAYARKFFKKTITTIAPDKAMHYTFGSINRTVKKNFNNFSRIARPWMAMKFTREYLPSTTLLKTTNLSQKKLGITQGRELLEGVFKQAQKTELVHTVAMFSVLMVIALLAITSSAPIGFVILGLILEFIYFTVRNTLVYGYLDAKGESFEIEHCIPQIVKDIHAWCKGKSKSKAIDEYSVQDFIDKRNQAMQATSYSKQLAHWMFA
jgi:hypothetical protein